MGWSHKVHPSAMLNFTLLGATLTSAMGDTCRSLCLCSVLSSSSMLKMSSPVRKEKHDTRHPATQLSKHTLSFAGRQPESLHWLDSTLQSSVPLLALKDNDMPTACLRPLIQGQRVPQPPWGSGWVCGFGKLTLCLLSGTTEKAFAKDSVRLHRATCCDA